MQQVMTEISQKRLEEEKRLAGEISAKRASEERVMADYLVRRKLEAARTLAQELAQMRLDAESKLEEEVETYRRTLKAQTLSKIGADFTVDIGLNGTLPTLDLREDADRRAVSDFVSYVSPIQSFGCAN